MYLAAKKNPMVLQPPTAKAATAAKAVEKKVEQKVNIIVNVHCKKIFFHLVSIDTLGLYYTWTRKCAVLTK